jgi:FKBP-type peptidyl-prolyl cis-trans isomerase FkpA
MKKLLFATACTVIVLYVLSCNKSDSNTGSCSGPTAVSDSTALLAFAKKYGITPVADTSWLYYQVVNPGAGASPSATSKVYVRYAGRFMDGTYFDSTATTIRFALDSLIKGWRYGLPKIKPGGRVKLLVPSSLAYGCLGFPPAVPPNAPIYFDIYLDSLK